MVCLAFPQIRFHEHHPEYKDYWSPETVNDTDTTPTTYDKPNSERLPEQDASDEPRTLQVACPPLLFSTVLSTLSMLLMLMLMLPFLFFV